MHDYDTSTRCPRPGLGRPRAGGRRRAIRSEIAALVPTPTETPSSASDGPSPDPEPATEEPEPAPEVPTEEPAEEPAAPAPAPEPTPAHVHFSSRKQAREAGAAPLYRGDPGYNPKLDRDNDGVACE